MRTIAELTEHECSTLRYCARVRCVDCSPGCPERIGLPWDEWSKFANAIYEHDRQEQLARARCP